MFYVLTLEIFKLWHWYFERCESKKVKLDSIRDWCFLHPFLTLDQDYFNRVFLSVTQHKSIMNQPRAVKNGNSTPYLPWWWSTTTWNWRKTAAETLQQDLVQLPPEVFCYRDWQRHKVFPISSMRRDLRVGEKWQIWTNCQSFIGKTKSG